MPPAWKLPFILTQGWEVRRVYATSLDIPFSDPRLGGQGVTVPSSVFFHPLPDGLYWQRTVWCEVGVEPRTSAQCTTKLGYRCNADPTE
jgi:hypothetical protein